MTGTTWDRSYKKAVKRVKSQLDLTFPRRSKILQVDERMPMLMVASIHKLIVEKLKKKKQNYLLSCHSLNIKSKAKEN